MVYPRIVPTSLNVITVRATCANRGGATDDRGRAAASGASHRVPGGRPAAWRGRSTSAGHPPGSWLAARRPRRLRREFTFGDFRDAFGFATRVALLAEREFHHPELTVTWGKVLVILWTQTVKGLSRNDVIIAAKVDRLA
jgi:pterin-4a-carbinolamine dehydratase